MRERAAETAMVMDVSPSPQSVGREFVRQYYTLLNKAPAHLHRFYNNLSSFVHGGLDTAERETLPVVGQKEIHNCIQQLNFRDCHARISQVDSQATLGNGVVVQVTGELSNAGAPMRRFTQTFVLAAQSPKKYYVHNDIFRYQDVVVVEEESEGEGEGSEGCEPAEEPEGGYYAPPAPATLPPAPAPAGYAVPVPVPAPFPATLPPAPAACLEPAPALQPPAAAGAQPPHLHHVNGHGHGHGHVADIGAGVQGVGGSAELEQGAEAEAEDADELQDVEPEPESQPPAQQQDAGSAGGAGAGPGPAQVSAPPEPKTYANLLKSGSGGAGGGAGAAPYAARAAPSAQHSSPPRAPPRPTMRVPPRAQPRHDHHAQPGGTKQLDESSVGGGGGGGAGAAASSGAPAGNSAGGAGGAGGAPAGSSAGGPAPARRYSDSQQLFLGNVPNIATEEELRVYFGRFGAVAELRIHSKGASNPRLPSYGFITYEDPASAHAALNAGPLYFPEGSADAVKLNVEEKKARRGGGGGGGGGPPGSGRGGAAGGAGRTRGPPFPPRQPYRR